MLKKTIVSHPWLCGLTLMWIMVVLSHAQFPLIIAEFGSFLFLGVAGAVFANATGAGGGVVFVPFFQQLSFSPQAVVATSFAIQCCGMTAGALSWLQYFRYTQVNALSWQPFLGVLKVTIPFGWLGLIIVQYAFEHGLPALSFTAFAEKLHLAFGLFSILLAVAIIASLKRLNAPVVQRKLTILDKRALVAISTLGGMVTAYLSVGIGELVAVYLIIRRFDVTMAIGAAVVLSAACVWVGALNHALFTAAINWPVVLFAGAGAVIGGRLARYVVMLFSPRQIKLFFAMWVFILGCLSMV